MQFCFSGKIVKKNFVKWDLTKLKLIDDFRWWFVQLGVDGEFCKIKFFKPRSINSYMYQISFFYWFIWFSNRNGIRPHNHLVHNRTVNQLVKLAKWLVKWPVWLNGWVFVYEISGCGFESCCCHLNFRYRTCFEQGVLWHSGN